MTGRSTTLFFCAWDPEKSNGQARQTGDRVRVRIWVMLESRRYLRRACKQAHEKSGGRGWGDGELWTPEPGFVGTWGPEKRSLLAFWWIPHVLEAGRGGGGGQGQVAPALGAASRRPTGGTPDPGSAGQGGRGPAAQIA